MLPTRVLFWRMFVITIASAAALPARSAAAQTPTVRDSAGVRIVQNPSRLQAPIVFRLGRPRLKVGGLEDNPDVEFNHKSGYLRGVQLSTGGVAVIDVVRVHYFGANAKRLKIVGRKGQGPSEYLELHDVCRTRGDTLVVSDQKNLRISILDAQGAFVRTIPFTYGSSIGLNSCFDDGTFVLEQSLTQGRREPRPVKVLRMRTDGSVANVIGTFTMPPFDFVAQGQQSFVPFGNHLAVADAVRSQVLVFGQAGKLETIVRTNDPVLPITAADVERRKSETIPTSVVGAERKRRMDTMADIPHGDSWPAYDDVKVAPNGQMWVQDYRAKRPADDIWTAFDTTGRILGRLVFPYLGPGTRQAQILGFGNDEVLLRQIDDDGASSVSVYPIVRIKP